MTADDATEKTTDTETNQDTEATDNTRSASAPTKDAPAHTDNDEGNTGADNAN